MEPKCNLIIDSCCDLPFEVVDREGVELINFPFIMDGKEHADDLFQTTSAKEFYDAMRVGAKPSTAQLSVPVLEDAFQRAIDSGFPTVFLCFSSGLSGSYDVACMIAERKKEQHPESELHVVDTLLASVAEALLVYEAIKQRDKGLTAKELVAWVEEARYFVDAEFMVDDLEALRRGGRIPSSVAMAGTKLDVKPLLSFNLDGTLALSGVTRGRKKAVKQLVDYYVKRVPSKTPGQCVVIGNADCQKDADRLKELLTKVDDSLLFLESSIGPTIGTHVGPDMLALVFWGPDRREDISVADRIARRIKGSAE